MAAPRYRVTLMPEEPRRFPRVRGRHETRPHSRLSRDTRASGLVQIRIRLWTPFDGGEIGARSAYEALLRHAGTGLQCRHSPAIPFA